MLNKKIPHNEIGLSSLTALDQRLTEASLPTVPAANAENYQHEQMKARRMRRQARQSRQASGRSGGWTTRLW